MRLFWLPVLLAAAAFGQSNEDAEFFEKKIRPVLASRCQMCHSAKMRTAGLDLSSAASFARGGDSGPLVSEGQPETSLLWKVLTYDERVKMPPTGKLGEAELADFRTWIARGAPWPGAPAAARQEARGGEGKSITEADRAHWAFRPVGSPAPPPVNDEGWARNAVDRFILARLEREGLKPAEPASRLAWLRRVTFNLTGLPPTPEEIADFQGDASAGARERVIDRLLASPRYGERWGRHWLDVARYAESTGMDENHGYPYAWRYRDYVVDAFRRDLPYDQFVREQIAGDLLAPPPGETVNSRGIVATGFLALGPKPLAQQDRVKMIYDVVDEQIDAASKAFLGLTIACARCHDHKFDPILTEDYYSLAAVFASTKNFRNLGRPGSVSYIHYTPLEPEKYAAWQAHRERTWRKLLEMEEALAGETRSRAAELDERLADYLIAAWRVLREKRPPAEAAAERGLDVHVLDRWVCLLGESAAKHWSAWREASASTVESVAAEYQRKYIESAEGWRKKLESWRKRYRTEAELDRTVPERPKVSAEDEPLLAEVAFERGPFDAGESARVQALRGELSSLEKTQPPMPAMASAVMDLDQPVAQHVFPRGDHHNHGKPVGPRFPLVFAEGQPARWPASGRLELADWMASAANPLTARVMVNRIWQWHFGEALMRSPNNWGITGEKPTHPELLDYLARRFIESGWSVKAMHRLILLSNTYGMSAASSPEARERDPDNRLWSHFTMRRLEVEAIRDSLLYVSGALDLAVGGDLAAGSKERRPNIKPESVARRTLYIPVSRGSLPALHSAFDFGDATTPSAGRSQTTIAPQALFLMNSEFVRRQAEGFAKRLLGDGSLTDAQRVGRAYLLALSRPAAASEIDQALSYIASTEKRRGGAEAWRSFCHALLASNEFLHTE